MFLHKETGNDNSHNICWFIVTFCLQVHNYYLCYTIILYCREYFKSLAGICQPLDDPKCEGRNDFVKDICSPVEFNCPAINETGIVIDYDVINLYENNILA